MQARPSHNGAKNIPDVISVGFHCHAIKKINQKPFNYKSNEFLQVSGLYGAPFASYLLKCFTQIYKAQYGDAIFVLLRVVSQKTSGIPI